MRSTAEKEANTMNHSSWKALLTHKALGLFLASLLLASSAAIIAGCASGTINPSNSVTAATAPSFVIGTDAPLPSVTSFNVTIDSITATTSTGSTVNLISGTPTVDFARFNGLQTLIDMNDVPADTYTSVTVTFGSATIGYLNVVSGAAPTIATQTATLTTNTVTKTLATPLTLTASAPVGLHMDFDLAKSIAVDSNGNITGSVTPTLTLGVVGPSDSGAYIDEFDAGVTGVNTTGQSFTITGPHGRTFTVNVNGSTEWDNNESLASLSTVSIVQISGTLDRTDATIDADDVSIVSQSGFYAGGLLTYVTPSSGTATSFDMYVHGLLPANTGLTLGQIAQIDLNGSENFFIRRMHDPLTQYLFNSATLLPGQHVSVGGPASGAANPNAVSVKRVVLRDRGYNGTVVASSVNTSTNTFQMQVTGFAGLVIPGTVTVYVDGNTSFRSGLTSLGSVNSIATGTAVRAVGLLVKDPITGKPVLQARYVDIVN
jgi:hypothetical protein